VRVEAETTLPVHDRLAAEVFQMVAEGPQYVRVHTRSASEGDAELSRMTHSTQHRPTGRRDGAVPIPFTPRSITERATPWVDARMSSGQSTVVG